MDPEARKEINEDLDKTERELIYYSVQEFVKWMLPRIVVLVIAAIMISMLCSCTAVPRDAIATIANTRMILDADLTDMKIDPGLITYELQVEHMERAVNILKATEERLEAEQGIGAWWSAFVEDLFGD